MMKGGRNLVLLGIIAVVVATLTTGVSLALYHYSGDIYLDRSRPGFLPDKEESEEKEESKEGIYVFDKTGPITKEALGEYLENLQIEVDSIDAYKEPFGESLLSDEALGIGQ